VKLGVLDVIWYDVPFESRLQRISKLGFGGVECWLNSAELGFRVDREWPETHRVEKVTLTKNKLSRLVDGLGLQVHSYGQYQVMGPVLGPYPTELLTGAKRKERVSDIKGLMNFCSDVGVKLLILESGGDPDNPSHWKSFVEDFMSELVSHAEKVDVTIGMENTPQALIKDEDDLLRLMREIPSKALKVNFDPANLNLSPPGNRDLPSAIRKLKGHIVSVHAKDSVYGGGPYGKMPDGTWRCPPIGQGTVPWRGCVDALKDIGFDGYLIIEYSYPFGVVPLRERDGAILSGKTYLESVLK
jgi:sugar phosphate isomerase/epimerase